MTASALLAATAPSSTFGLEAHRPSGSAVAKTMSPTPRPAPNIIENQEKLPNSGFSPGRPSSFLPVAGSSASTNRKKANTPVAMT